MAELPPYLRPPELWTPETLSARNLVCYRDASLLLWCEGCNTTRQANAWRIGARLADDPLQTLRLRCLECGVYIERMHVDIRRGGMVDKLLTIPMKPRAWDESHIAAQKAALARAIARREARHTAQIEAWRRGTNPTPST
ncbi:hypothetical protein ACFPIF_11715 [Brevundimonas faecalis]|uniref:hypothetical protein n=1 Tax=Brevundimonas faecalis TaxID=947378 RepID=UPI003605D275